MIRFLLAAASLLALTSPTQAWTGFTPGPEYRPTLCFISPQPGTTIAISPMEPDTTRTAGGQALMLGGVQAAHFPLDAAPIAEAARRLRAAGAAAGLDLADSVAVMADMRLMRGEQADGSFTVAIPLRSEVVGSPLLTDGVTLQDVAPRSVAEMRLDGRRSDVPAGVRKLMDFVATKGLQAGETFIYEFYGDGDLTSPVGTVEMCVEVR